ncbi:hypothetical protein MKK70_16750 [Methylobacterium sp. E-041]|uniref:hypothetical protein n=1 Tax=Methylobacterium sp. E-041 TaxID=2836573 RepID=UPI001FB88D65|nr:hypothetical protein [Methylobacterium sp. E-041]MCJ2106996.1 hypothetical protein [Methylobacterium sp. E-041]
MLDKRAAGQVTCRTFLRPFSTAIPFFAQGKNEPEKTWRQKTMPIQPVERM